MTNNNMYFIANWKMYGNIKDINRLKPVIKLSKSSRLKNHKIIYCPPYTLLSDFYKKVCRTKIYIGAQNCHQNSEYGPFTGFINSKLIKSTGAKYIIIGHSENRIQGDTNITINKKIKSALKENLKVIFCIGESLSEKKKNLTNKVLKKQVIDGLKGIKKINNIIVSYEPVWSIGTGLIPKNNMLEKNLNFISETIKKFKGRNTNKILYGGSVNPKNVEELIKIKDIGGFLVGGSSLNSNKFVDIIKKSIN